jgi:hypothetical protein
MLWALTCLRLQHIHSKRMNHSNNTTQPSCQDHAFERHFSVAEVAELWKLNQTTIRRIFRDEPGVLKFGSQETRFKRGYMTLKIPESVLQRVHTRLRSR